MGTSRRQFAKTLTVAIAAAGAGAQEKEKPANAFGVALTGLVRAQYGQFLSDEEMTRVAKDFQDYAPFVEGFRNFPLKNGDEPDFTFHSLTDRW